MYIWKQLWAYTKPYKRFLFYSLFALMLSTTIFIVGTMMTKIIIDKYIMGMFRPVSVSNTIQDEKKSVFYKGKYYTRIEENSKLNILEKNSIILTKEGYVLINSDIADEKAEIKDNRLFINNKESNVGFNILTKDEVWNFYEPYVGSATLAVLSIFILYMAAACLMYTCGYSLRILATKVVFDLRKDAFKQLQKLPVQYFSDYPDGKVVSYIVHDSNAIFGLYENTLLEIVKAVVQVVFIYIAMFLLNVKLASYALLILPIIAVWLYLYRKYVSENFKETREIQSNMNAMMNEQFQGIEVVQAFTHEDESIAEFDVLADDYLEYKRKFAVLSALYTDGMAHTVRRLAITLTLVYFGREFLSGSMILSVGTVFAFVQYVDSAFAPLFWFFGVLNRFERAIVSARRIFDMFLNVPSKELEFSTENLELKGNVEFKNLSFAYDNENYVLKNINLIIPAGNTIGIVGHTGSGKSSLMNVLLRFYDYQKGDIVIDGRSLRDYPVQTYRAHVGMVLQDPVLFSGTLFSNITFNNNGVTEERVLEIMSQIGAQSFIDKQPNGIHESVEDMGRNFSVGERQLIAFARVMVYDPEILILDEATANIDTETEIMIQKALNVISQNRTTFIIAHRLSTVKHADQLIVLNKGNIVERGTHEELVEKDGLYAKMYQSQMREEYTHEVLKNSKENFVLNM